MCFRQKVFMPGLSKQHKGQWELLQLLLLLLHCGFANGGFSHKEKLATLIDPLLLATH
jgi:hypothetical protein